MNISIHTKHLSHQEEHQTVEFILSSILVESITVNIKWERVDKYELEAAFLSAVETGLEIVTNRLIKSDTVIDPLFNMSTNIPILSFNNYFTCLTLIRIICILLHMSRKKQGWYDFIKIGLSSNNNPSIYFCLFIHWSILVINLMQIYRLRPCQSRHHFWIRTMDTSWILMLLDTRSLVVSSWDGTLDSLVTWTNDE